MDNRVLIKHLGTEDYKDCWEAMQEFTEQRDSNTPDQLWLVQHPAVFTLGQAGKSMHILNAHNIPVINTDRGGQVTYHGPGQIIIYTLIDIRRLGLGARALVSAIENSIIQSLASFNIVAFSKKQAPGVYVKTKDNSKSNSANIHSAEDAKIAALGLRIRKGSSYHGLSINFDMNLNPFSFINPCGYQDQQVTQVSHLNSTVKQTEFEQILLNNLCANLALKPI